MPSRPAGQSRLGAALQFDLLLLAEGFEGAPGKLPPVQQKDSMGRSRWFFPAAFSSTRGLPPARVVGEVNQSISIIDLDLQHPQKFKPKDARDLGTRVLADLGQIEAHDILVLLGEVAKSKRCFVSTVNVGHSPAESLYVHIGVGADLSDLATGPCGEKVERRACID